MVNPVTGPTTTTKNIPGPTTAGGFTPIWMSELRVSSKQKAPYDLVLPYRVEKRYVSSFYDVSKYGYIQASGSPYWTDSHINLAVAKAYGQVSEVLADRSEWLVSLAEGRQAAQLIEKRATQLWRGFRALSRGKVHDFIRIMGQSDHVQWNRIKHRYQSRSKPKRLADAWLEFHFAVEPALKDCASAMAVLSRDEFAHIPIKGSGTSSGTIDESFSDVYENRTVKTTHRASVKMGGVVHITNHNAFLAQQLGFANPASFVWERVPFSFVVDWFSNVGQVLSSWTDFLGCTLQGTWTYTKQKSTRTDIYWGKPGYTYQPDPPPAKPVSLEGVLTRRYQWDFFGATRRQGLVLPSLVVKPFRGFSVVRGATAVALLLQFLKN